MVLAFAVALEVSRVPRLPSLQVGRRITHHSREARSRNRFAFALEVSAGAPYAGFSVWDARSKILE